MAQLTADHQSRPQVNLPLLWSQSLFAGAAGMGRWPACDFQVSLLRVGVAQAMHLRQAGVRRVALVDSQLLDVGAAPGDQGPRTRHAFGLFEQGTLRLAPVSFYIRSTKDSLKYEY